MDFKEILRLAICKAEDQGYKLDALHNHIHRNYRNSIEVQLLSMYATIFTHDFAKAFWGEKLICLNLYAKEPPFADEMVHLPAFAYHLQKMVLESDPANYLEKFL